MTSSPNRKKFLLWGAALVASISAVRFLKRKPQATKTVKMLTRDGKLVEVNRDVISRLEKIKKISNEELQNWVKK
jgi:hypothetical protein